jgi:DNA-binding XRE family transcriptional regulator
MGSARSSEVIALQNDSANMPAMTARQFKNWRKRMGWTQPRAAEELGRTKRQIIYYETGEQEIPKAIELACKYLEERSNG